MNGCAHVVCRLFVRLACARTDGRVLSVFRILKLIHYGLVPGEYEPSNSKTRALQTSPH
jgi:hypothetical protein